MASTKSSQLDAGGGIRTSHPEPQPRNEASPGLKGPDVRWKERRNQAAQELWRYEASARVDAFWARMARCPTVEALEREIAREWHERHCAAQATIEAFMLGLRKGGVEALAEPYTDRLLSEISLIQIEQCMERIAVHEGRYPDARELLDALAEIIAEQAE